MYQRLSFLFVFILACSALQSQQIDSLLDIQRQADPREKIHVHFDKAFYNPGETIWFKAYIFSGNTPSQTSKTFYADLLDDQGKLISRHSAPISFSGASGSFVLDTSYAKPAVHFRAYTLSMLNGDTSFLFTNAIRVLQKSQAAGANAKQFESKLVFLPEGGQWVAGLPSTMAFLATDNRGLPVNASGIIVDNAGRQVAEFKTIHNGMGRMMLLPEAHKMYTARWKDQRGKQYSTALPATIVDGMVLKIVDEEARKRFTIIRTTDAAKQVHVLAYMNQELYYKADIDLSNRESASGVFPTANMPTGILSISVLDANYQPLLERISFVNNHDYEFDGDVYMTLKNPAKRALNKLEISITDTLPANLSLSITDADLNESAPMEDNIISRILLTSELRGKIVNPYFYLYSNSDSVAAYVDLVMLTHGWRRYDWSRVLAGKTNAPRWKEHNYLSLDGQLVGFPRGKLAANLQLNGILEAADTSRTVLVFPVDKEGKMFADGLLFYGDARLYFNFNDKNIPVSNGVLQVNNGLYKATGSTMPDTMLLKTLAEPTQATLAANSKAATLARQAGQQGPKSVMLENVIVAGRSKTPKQKLEEKYVSSMFAGDGNSFDLVNDPVGISSMNIFQYLQGKVAGLQISDPSGQPTLSWRGGSPALYLNEMRADIEQLSSMTVSDIAYIKIFRPGESVAFGGGGGLIAIYTRKGSDAPVNPNMRGMSYVQVAGYTPVKEFYAPDYATAAANDGYADYRPTLYWNPSIYVDKSRRRVRLQFYNNDVTRNFKLVLEGINTDGKLIHVEKKVLAEIK
jgi:hypothetical protein